MPVVVVLSPTPGGVEGRSALFEEHLLSHTCFPPLSFSQSGNIAPWTILEIHTLAANNLRTFGCIDSMVEKSSSLDSRW